MDETTRAAQVEAQRRYSGQRQYVGTVDDREALARRLARDLAWTGPWEVYLPTADWIIQHQTAPSVSREQRQRVVLAMHGALHDEPLHWSGRGPAAERCTDAALTALGIQVRDVD